METRIYGFGSNAPGELLSSKISLVVRFLEFCLNCDEPSEVQCNRASRVRALGRKISPPRLRQKRPPDNRKKRAGWSLPEGPKKAIGELSTNAGSGFMLYSVERDTIEALGN